MEKYAPGRPREALGLDLEPTDTPAPLAAPSTAPFRPSLSARRLAPGAFRPGAAPVTARSTYLVS